MNDPVVPRVEVLQPIEKKEVLKTPEVASATQTAKMPTPKTLPQKAEFKPAVNIVDTTTNKANPHPLKTDDKTTKTADKKEEDFIAEVETAHDNTRSK